MLGLDVAPGVCAGTERRTPPIVLLEERFDSPVDGVGRTCGTVGSEFPVVGVRGSGVGMRPVPRIDADEVTDLVLAVSMPSCPCSIRPLIVALPCLVVLLTTEALRRPFDSFEPTLPLFWRALEVDRFG